MKRVLCTALMLLTTLGLEATAQSRVCIGGDLGRLSSAEKTRCLAAAARVRTEADRFNAPADWHFFIVCSEYDWQTYAAYSDRSAAELANLTVDTSIERRTTFFRGERLATEPTGLKLAVAREVAKAILKTDDELAIVDRVSLWLPVTQPAQPDRGALRASR